jgi:transposase-like protein
LTLFDNQKGDQQMSDYKIPAKDRWKNRYSYAYKREVIESIENGKLSQNQASRIYGVHRKTIRGWLDKYGNFDKKLREMGGKSPKQNLADLRAKLRVAQGENQVLKAVMSIIEEEYGEEMLKKYLPESLLKTIPKRKQK